MNRIVEEFLLSTKAGQSMEPQNLRGIIEEVVTMLREKADAAGVVISNETAGRLSLECQKERMKQVLYNLIMNGIEAMSDGGAIHIASVAGQPPGPAAS